MPEASEVDVAALVVERRERTDGMAAEYTAATGLDASLGIDPSGDGISDPSSSALRGIGVSAAPSGTAAALLIQRSVSSGNVILVEGPDRGGVQRVGGQAYLAVEDPGALAGTVVGTVSVDTRQAVETAVTPDGAAASAPVQAGATQRVETALEGAGDPAEGTRRSRAGRDPRAARDFGTEAPGRGRGGRAARAVAEQDVPDPGASAPAAGTPDAPGSGGAAPISSPGGGGLDF